MYVYYDSNGVLKEIITERNYRVGDSKRDKIYVYWDGEHSPYGAWIKYRLPNRQYTAEEEFYNYYSSLVGKELPQEPVRNLKYFDYNHTYTENGVVKSGYLFYEITLPDEVLNSALVSEQFSTENNLVVARIRFTFDDGIVSLGALPFSVETNIGILTDNSINSSQYNYLIRAIGESTGIYYTPHVSDDGVLSWTNSGDKPNPAPVNITGPKGDKGDVGPQGIQGEPAINATYFKINDGGHLIMYYSNETTPNIYLVSDDENSSSYYETLGVPSNLVGHLVFIYS